MDTELEDEQCVKTLQKLNALKFLRIDEQLFEREGALACTRGWTKEKDEPKIEVEMLRDWMVDMLPRGLDTDNIIILTWATHSWPYDKAWLLFRDLAKLKDEQLPDLEQLTID